jgi:chromosomal replication initiator protein
MNEPSIKAIQQAVASYFGVPLVDMKSERRRFCRPRQVAYYLSARMTSKSAASIARWFDKDRTTIGHGVLCIEKLCQHDHELRRRVDNLAKEITSGVRRASAKEPVPFKFGPLPPCPVPPNYAA